MMIKRTSPESPKKPHASMGTLSLTKEARIYNGGKTASSITGELWVKE